MKATTWLLVIVVTLIVLFVLAKPKVAMATPAAAQPGPAHPLPMGLANEARGAVAAVGTFADLLKGFKSPFAGTVYTPAQIQEAQAPTITVTDTGGVTFFG